MLPNKLDLEEALNIVLQGQFASRWTELYRYWLTPMSVPHRVWLEWCLDLKLSISELSIKLLEENFESWFELWQILSQSYSYQGCRQHEQPIMSWLDSAVVDITKRPEWWHLSDLLIADDMKFHDAYNSQDQKALQAFDLELLNEIKTMHQDPAVRLITNCVTAVASGKDSCYLYSPVGYLVTRLVLSACSRLRLRALALLANREVRKVHPNNQVYFKLDNFPHWNGEPDGVYACLAGNRLFFDLGKPSLH